MAKFKRGSLTLARQVFNTPQLVLAEDLQTIAQYLVSRANGNDIDYTQDAVTDKTEVDAYVSEADETERKQRKLGITNDGKRGNLDVSGTLVAKAGNIDADCMEMTSYEGLYDKFAKQVQEGIQELVLHVDSGGGSAFSCFEMASEVKALAKEKDISIYAYVDGLAASAAYAWASIADEIIARPDSEVGSVGVVVQLINNSKMLENIGITRQFVCHGEQKVPFTAEGDFSPQFLSNIQKKVDKTGLEFSSFIATNRNMRVEDVLATQAEVFDSEEALKVGFIDKIMTKSEFFNEYLPSLNKETGTTSNSNTYGLSTVNQKETEETMIVKTPTEPQAKLTTDIAPVSQDMAEKLAEFESKNLELNGTLKELSDKLAAAEEREKELVAGIESKELETRTNARQAKLETLLGAENPKVQNLMASTATLSDEAFADIAESMSSLQVDKQESLQELGGEGQESEVQLDLAQQMKRTAEAMKTR
jgi:ClpP class serine protease